MKIGETKLLLGFPIGSVKYSDGPQHVKNRFIECKRALNDFFELKVEVKRIRNGEHQTLETLINEEVLLFAKYLRARSREYPKK